MTYLHAVLARFQVVKIGEAENHVPFIGDNVTPSISGRAQRQLIGSWLGQVSERQRIQIVKVRAVRSLHEVPIIFSIWPFVLYHHVFILGVCEKLYAERVITLIQKNAAARCRGFVPS